MSKKVDGGRVFFGINTREFNRGLNSMRRKVDQFSYKMNAMSASMQRALFGIGVATTAAIAKFSKFEDGLKQIGTLGVKNLGQVKEELIKLRKEYGITGAEATKGYYDVVSAGAKTHEQATSRLTAAVKLAKAGNTDLYRAVDVLTTAINVYGEKGETSTSITNKLFSAVKDGKTTVEELGESLGNSASIAAAANVEFSELTGMYALLTSRGLDTNEATTAINAILKGVVKTSAGAAARAKELGIEFNTEALAAKGLAGFLEDVAEKTGRNIKKIGQLFPNMRALKGATIALSEQGLVKLKDSINNANNSAGTMKNVMAGISSSASFKWKKALQGVVVVFERIGESIQKTLTPALNWFNKISGAKSQSDTARLVANLLQMSAALLLIGVATTKFLAIASLFIGTRGVFGMIGVLVRFKTVAMAATGVMALLKVGIIALASASGIGLLLIALGLIYSNWDKIVNAFKKYELITIIKFTVATVKHYVDAVSAKLLGIGDAFEAAVNRSKIAVRKMKLFVLEMLGLEKQAAKPQRADYKGRNGDKRFSAAKEKWKATDYSAQGKLKSEIAELEADGKNIAAIDRGAAVGPVPTLSGIRAEEEAAAAAEAAEASLLNNNAPANQGEPPAAAAGGEFGGDDGQGEIDDAGGQGELDDEALNEEKLQKELDYLNLKDEQVLLHRERKIETEDEWNEVDNERDTELKNIELEKDAAHRAFSDEQIAEYLSAGIERDGENREKEIEDTLAHYDEQLQAKADYEASKTAKQRAANLERYKLEQKHESAMETLNSASASALEKVAALGQTKQYKVAKDTVKNLLSIASEGSAAVKAFKVADALQNMAISLATSLPQAYAQALAAYPPPFGEILGRISQASIITSNAIGVSKIAGFNEGGVTTGADGIDKNIMATTPGEFVVPEENAQEVIEREAQNLNNTSGEGGQTIEINLTLDGESLARKLVEINEQDNVL